MARTLIALLLAAAPLLAISAPEVKRVEAGNRITENVPDVSPELMQKYERYSNTRGATPAGWVANGPGLLITTRFANTSQVHWVKMPGGARQQLTFFEDPIASVVANPKRPGFVFGKDTGGSEFWQLYWFDLDTREIKLLTDGKSRNESPLFSHDGKKLAYSSTARNGKDTDVWLLDLDSGEKKPIVAEGGTWYATDFSPDGKRLVALHYVSANETHPVNVDLDSGKITPLDDGKQKVAYSNFRFATTGKGAYFISDESGEFRELRHHDFATNKIESMTAKIPWDVTDFALSEDGKRVAYVSNEDGFGVLHVVDAITGAETPLPELPKGVSFGPDFSADGNVVSFAVNSATSPSDVYSIDLAAKKLERWTESEVGGLDASRFVAPTLVRFPTFDKAAKGARTIPAFYYKPKGDGPFPVIVNIHGGPESQSQPTFSAETQFLVNELGIAVLVPNVRGSSGYGKTYLKLDDGFKREDSVKDIGALLDWVGKQRELDAKRVAVYGGSYGGYMVLAVMTHYNARLRAGVDLVGISNFLTFLAHTEEYRRDLRRVEYGDERDPNMHAFLEKISPTASAKSITISLFVAAGANDPRVPASEGEQIAHTVRANGAEVWFLEYKDEGHGFRKKANNDYFRAAMMQFWQTHLLGK